MKLKKIAVAVVSLLLIFLGGLWFLQGVAILSLCPILCFVDCQCITGQSPFWAVVGVVTLILGISILVATWKH
jgi:membrane-bound ClpP family serine protease